MRSRSRRSARAHANAESVSASTWAMWISYGSEWLCSFPNLIENFRGKGRLVLRQEATVVLLNDIRRVLDGITRLLIRSGLLEDMRCQNIPEIMRSMREQSFDGAAAGIGIVDP